MVGRLGRKQRPGGGGGQSRAGKGESEERGQESWGIEQEQK